jgi:hypothetical protein
MVMTKTSMGERSQLDRGGVYLCHANFIYLICCAEGVRDGLYFANVQGCLFLFFFLICGRCGKEDLSVGCKLYK